MDAAEPPVRPSVETLREAWPVLGPDERVEMFAELTRDEAEEFFLTLTARAQAIIIRSCPLGERRLWMRLLPPDDAADVLQEVEVEEREEWLGLLDTSVQREVRALLAWQEDEAGGLMSPRFARVRPEMTVEEALRYLRRQVRERLETVYYAYALDPQQQLLGVISLRQLFAADGDARVSEIMEREVVTVPPDMDQEAVAHVIAQHDLLAVPVVDAERHMKGIVTVDDVVDVVQSEATEDIHKMGGLEALPAPYLQTRFLPMLRRRGGWLAVLFVGEMLTASVMAHYEAAIARAVVLALFLPLIISSGGNSGSQATTLVIRAMALGEVRLRDWWRVVRRELAAGVGLGVLLAVIGLFRVLAWQGLFGTYGAHAGLLAFTVSVSLVGVVTWGTLVGAMLPFLLRRLKLDPASASAPFVATLVDVSGLVIYFTVAAVVMKGTML
jgi:magnesium transporter